MAEKIDNLTLEIYEIVTVGFLVHDKLDKVQFFDKIFLLVIIGMKMVLGMFFLSFSNICL